MDHIVTAVFTPGTTETVAQDALYQWAYGQTLRLEGIELPEAYQVDFSNFEFCGESIPRVGGADGVSVPVEVLRSGSPVYAFFWAIDQTSGRTWYRVEIRVIPRPVPDLDTPSPEEESAIAEAIAALNDGVDAAEAQAVLAQSWAVGGTGTREGEDTNNAKYWAEQAQGGGGGGGGTTDYSALSNKPAINGHTLQGDQTADQLGLATPSDIPAVPTKTSELANDSGFVDAAGAAAAAPVQSVNGKTGAVVLSAADVGAGTYSKPAGGIPASDLAPGVIPAVPTKTSELANDSGFVDAAGAAAAAPVQSVNGKTGAVVLGAADVGAGTYSKPSGGIPATDLASAVRTSLDKADSALQSVPSTYRTAAAQDAIDSGKADKITEVTISTAGAVTQALDAGKIYHFTGALSALTLTLNAPASGQIAQYHFDFSTGSTPPTLTLPQTVTMPDGISVEANKRYEVDILNNFGAVISWTLS